MNKKEIAEIRKQFKPENAVISNICGCYVDAEKEKKLTFRQAFLSLSEEEVFKYCDIFRRTLSGTFGKNLWNMEFPLEQEQPEGTQEFLLKLRDSALAEDDLLEGFYDKVIESYVYPENYLILLIDATYDIPGKASDNLEMFDASDNVYHFLLCSICPVNLSKGGLCYNPVSNAIEERVRDWVVEIPVKGFLFPAMTDRDTDIHSAVYFSKKPEELQEEFIETVLGCPLPMSAAGQRETFNTLLADTLGDQCGYEVVKNIHEELNEMLDEHDRMEELEPLMLEKQDIRRLMEQGGAPEESLECFEETFDAVSGEQSSLLATNIANPKKFSIQTPDVVVTVNPERADLVETRLIDGKQCLLITVDDHIEVNGVNVRTLPRQGSEE
ncbi:MAG: DUF4317 domain-containing protein [Lachnospiraceae bacterium]|nr:DUF4317 domain-containing protein [Lachnospiraceae bacterium]MCI9546842.1 DUF4317 domain-containing protein [Lachnospiraceae bacterium]